MRWRGLLVAVLLLGLCLAPARPQEPTITVGSKAFSEGQLLAEILATLIETRLDVKVQRRMGLGGTLICFEALRTGQIDLYPEYTGTGLLEILKAKEIGRPGDVLGKVRDGFADRYQLIWLEPIGFNNTYAMAVRTETARKLGLERISDLREHPELVYGFSHEFLNREDGWPALAAAYGLKPNEVRGLEHGLAYKALQDSKIDVTDAYSTDGKLKAHHLTVLEDDKRFFPPYHAAPVVRQATLQRHPQLGPLLNELAGRMDDETMQSLNYRVEVEGHSFSTVAREFLQQSDLAKFSETQVEGGRHQPFWSFFWERRYKTLELAGRHLQLAGVAVLMALLIGVPISIAMTRMTWLARPVLALTGMIQTIPGIALLGFMLPFLGIGTTPAIVALFLYALLPIVANTYAGIRQVDPSLVEAADGMGLSDGQILQLVELPLAVPVIMAGVRTSAVINIGTATLAAFIGAGGLGEPIVTGLTLNDNNLILSGAIPAALLALGVDLILGRIEYAATPRMMRPR